MATEEEFGKAPAAPGLGAGDEPCVLLTVKEKKCFTNAETQRQRQCQQLLRILCCEWHIGVGEMDINVL